MEPFSLDSEPPGLQRPYTGWSISCLLHPEHYYHWLLTTVSSAVPQTGILKREKEKNHVILSVLTPFCHRCFHAGEIHSWMGEENLQAANPETVLTLEWCILPDSGRRNYPPEWATIQKSTVVFVSVSLSTFHEFGMSVFYWYHRCIHCSRVNIQKSKCSLWI